MGRQSAADLTALGDTKFLFQHLVDLCRVGFAARRFHDLADEPAEHRWFGFGLFDFVRIGSDYIVDGFLDGAGVGHLLHAALLDDCRGVAAFGPDDFEQVFGELAGDHFVRNQVDDAAELLGRDRRVRDAQVLLVQAAE